MRLLLVITCLFSCLLGRADDSEPTEAIIRLRPGAKWELGDAVCLMRDGERLTCGSVVRVTPLWIHIAIPYKDRDLPHGQVIQVVPQSEERRLTNIDKEEFVVTRGSKSAVVTKSTYAHAQHLLGAGGFFGSGYAIPFVQGQFSLTPALSLGFLVGYTKVEDTGANISSVIALMNAEYFFFRSGFKGPYLSGGAGLYAFRIFLDGQTEGSFAPAFQGVVGWRFRLADILTLAVSGGGQVVFDPQSALIKPAVVGVTPMARADLSFSF